MKHPWNISASEAIALQKKLQKEVKIQPLEKEVQYILIK